MLANAADPIPIYLLMLGLPKPLLGPLLGSSWSFISAKFHSIDLQIITVRSIGVSLWLFIPEVIGAVSAPFRQVSDQNYSKLLSGPSSSPAGDVLTSLVISIKWATVDRVNYGPSIWQDKEEKLRRPSVMRKSPYAGRILGVDPNLRGTGLAVLECVVKTGSYCIPRLSS